MPTPLTWDSPANLTWDSAGLTWDSQTNSTTTCKVRPNDNRICAILGDADKAAVLAAFQTIKTKLPFLINLTPAVRQSSLAGHRRL